MKPVLLDTNAFAMVLTDDARLPKRIKEMISQAPRASISAITFNEISQKVRLGKWDEMAKFAPNLVDIALGDGSDLISLSRIPPPKRRYLIGPIKILLTG